MLAYYRASLPTYHPRGPLSIWLYGFMSGVRSCRKLEVACRDQIPYLWLTGWQHPDHNTLWRFYQAHWQAMRRLLKPNCDSRGASRFSRPSSTGDRWDQGSSQCSG